MRPLNIRGKVRNASGLPLVCTPLIGNTVEAIEGELAAILPLSPDLIEWRVDYFAHIDNSAQVIEVARKIRHAAGEIPLIFTRRAAHEGGQAITISEEYVVALYEEVCASGAIDVVDYELSQSAVHRTRVRAAAHANNLALIFSYHNFVETPGADELIGIMADAEKQGADIAKVAVMPKTQADVLTLLAATLAADNALRIPVITMSMGSMGAVSRLCGGAFGSAVTFAVGSGASAPGQIAIGDLRTAQQILQRAGSDA